MRIDIKMPSLAQQRPLEVNQSFVELEENYLRYCVEFTAEEWVSEDDEGLGKKEEFNFIDVIAFKKHIPGVEIMKTTDPDRYRVLIPVQGFGQDIRIYFKKREEAQELTNTIKTWLLNEIS